MDENEISYLIRGCIFKVYNAIGPGLLESAYCAALAYELRKEGLDVKEQLGLPFVYEEIKLDIGYRIDLLVNDKVVIEVFKYDLRIPNSPTFLRLQYQHICTILNRSTLFFTL